MRSISWRNGDKHDDIGICVRLNTSRDIIVLLVNRLVGKHEMHSIFIVPAATTPKDVDDTRWQY